MIYFAQSRPISLKAMEVVVHLVRPRSILCEEGELTGCNRCHVDFFISVLLSLNTAVQLPKMRRKGAI